MSLLKILPPNLELLNKLSAEEEEQALEAIRSYANRNRIGFAQELKAITEQKQIDDEVLSFVYEALWMDKKPWEARFWQAEFERTWKRATEGTPFDFQNVLAEILTGVDCTEDLGTITRVIQHLQSGLRHPNEQVQALSLWCLCWGISYMETPSKDETDQMLKEKLQSPEKKIRYWAYMHLKNAGVLKRGEGLVFWDKVNYWIENAQSYYGAK